MRKERTIRELEGRKLYKVLRRDGSSQFRHMSYVDHLPEGRRPGKWTKKSPGLPALCSAGYHAWIGIKEARGYGPRTGDLIFECELEDIGQSDGEKVCGRRLRLLRFVGIMVEISGATWMFKRLRRRPPTRRRPPV